VLTRAGVSCSGYPGWETNSRSSGGFEALLGIVAHHTASDTTPANDLNYMVNGPDNPISNGLLDRSGHFTAIASGASNHAGKGGGSAEGGGTAWHCSKGTVPADSGNSRCFGIEAANNGVGQPWPQAQQDAYTKMCAAVSDAYGLVMPSDLRSHAEWSPPRKIDPRGPAKWQPANTSSPWAMDGFRSDVAALMAGVPPIPGPTGDMMLHRIAIKSDAPHPQRANAKFVGMMDGNGLGHTISWVRTEAEYKQYETLKAPLRELFMEDLAGLILLGPLPSGDSLHAWTGGEFDLHVG
jgi:hypothetical protein